MNKHNITFRGVEYDLRQVTWPDGTDTTIGSYSLYTALFGEDAHEAYENNEDVRKVDDLIFYYLDDEFLDLSDEAVVKEICETSPGEFDDMLVPKGDEQ